MEILVHLDFLDQRELKYATPLFPCINQHTNNLLPQGDVGSVGPFGPPGAPGAPAFFPLGVRTTRVANACCYVANLGFYCRVTAPRDPLLFPLLVTEAQEAYLVLLEHE